MTMGKISEKFIHLLQDVKVFKSCVTGTQKPEYFVSRLEGF